MNAHVVSPVALTQDWDALDRGKFADETATVAAILKQVPLKGEVRAGVVAGPSIWSSGRGAASRSEGVVESFLQEFSPRHPRGSGPDVSG